MQISKRSAFITPLAWIVLVIVLLIIVIGGFVAYTKVKNRDSVNEI